MSFAKTLIKEDGFGFVPASSSIPIKRPREIIRRYTMTNKYKASVCLISWGATIQSIKVPGRDGKLVDIVLGFDDIDGYLKNRYMGSTIGRVVNYISEDLMCLNDTNYPLLINERINREEFDGGDGGGGGGGDGAITFDNVNWQSQVVNNQVVMSHLSPANGVDGYPGNVLTQIKYTWTDDNQLHINIRATTTQSTPINITNYCLFNLAGHSTGSKELRKHVLTINADSWVSTNVRNNLPTGVISPVDYTVLDLRLPAQLNQRRLSDIPGGGYNHNMYINSPSYQCYRFHARILHPTSGRFLEVYSNHPGLRVYTCNDLPDPELIYLHDLNDCEWNVSHIDSLKSLEQTREIGVDKVKREIYGKGGIPYRRYDGFALSPRNYPNVEHAPSCILHPGKIYVHDMTYKFGVSF